MLVKKKKGSDDSKDERGMGQWRTDDDTVMVDIIIVSLSRP